MATFNAAWVPEFGASAEPRSNTTLHKFGDGYEQEQANGMNSYAEDWPLTFNYLPKATADAIWQFFIDNEGIAFDWTPPDGAAPLKYKCHAGDRKKVKQKNNYFTITAKFVQVFEP